ncbi:vWA domain-containing protein [Anaerotruncus rubiinfantis]|uniref:vWA domain-containing protein n=1 Tax=Anaerotruncus rubiinfantis TaxID=1720200 RepID=UPI003D7A5F28
MKDVFLNMSALMQTDWFKNLPSRPPAQKKQVLKSLRVEDETYRQARRDMPALDDIEQEMESRLPTVRHLTRDMFQSFYALTLRHNEESELTPQVRRFNRYLLGKMMQQPDFPVVKALCEGKPYPSMEAAEEFMRHLSGNLNELLEAANGPKKTLDALEVQEAKQRERLTLLKSLSNKEKRQGLTPEEEQKMKEEIKCAYRKLEQLERLNQMARDNLLGSRKANQIITKAAQAAFERAREAQDILRAWGDDAAEETPGGADRELVEKVRQNTILLQIARYLGRMKEMIRQKRLNGFSYGRGEKYGLELGNSFSRLISSEFSLLAAPETQPIFLRKYQQKKLKQYARREKICKGRGHKIVCLDQSSSTTGENAAWGKAVAYALLLVTQLDKANFALIRFARRGNFHTDHYLSGQVSTAQIMEDAQNCGFLGGGTDYETPLTEAIRLMEDNGYRNADIAFITDGVCQLSEEFTQKLQEKKAALGFRITGILMDQDDPGMEFTLQPFCDDILRLSEMGRDDAAAKIVEKFA